MIFKTITAHQLLFPLSLSDFPTADKTTNPPNVILSIFLNVLNSVTADTYKGLLNLVPIDDSMVQMSRTHTLIVHHVNPMYNICSHDLFSLFITITVC